jgi:hypothetical protein
MISAIPNYSKITNTPYFKSLLKKPVDPDNPTYTYDNKLASMFKGQKTNDIINFFNKVNEKVNGGLNGKVTPVVDSSSTPPPGISSKRITSEQFTDIMKKIMKGEVKASEEQLAKLRGLMANQSMRN